MTILNIRYLLDTSVLSELSKDSHRQRLAFRNWLTSVPERSLHLPYSAALEIQRGIVRLRQLNPQKADWLGMWFDDLQSKLPFMPMTLEAAQIHAELTSQSALRHLWINDPRKKKPGPQQSLAIAATAIASNTCVVTRNVSDFELIDRYFPLPGILNPIDQADGLHAPVSATTFH